MDEDRPAIVSRLTTLQNTINALPPGSPKTDVQSGFNGLVTTLEQSGACGPLRVGIELPAATEEGV